MTNTSEKERVEGSEGVIQGNKLIAEFMGATFVSEDAYGTGDFKHFALYEYGQHPDFMIKSAGRKFQVCDLIYEQSWDWLMPVCQKINAPESLIKVEMNGVESITPYLNAKREMCNGAIRFDLERTWKGVVSFIKYHNQLKNK